MFFQKLYFFIRLYSPFVGPWLFFSFPNPIHGRTPWAGGQQTSMPPVEFEPTISVMERAKAVHASHRTATVIGVHQQTQTKYVAEQMSVNVKYSVDLQIRTSQSVSRTVSRRYELLTERKCSHFEQPFSWFCNKEISNVT
jgi:hypothetical protein